MKPLTTAILVQCGYAPEVDKYLYWLNELLPLYGVSTHLRLSHFLGQVALESDRGKAEHEYASGEAYENRADLGNTHPGDGKRYRGRGGIQCTGRANYAAFSKKYGVDAINHPELLEEPKWWVASALWYWNSRNLNVLAELDDTLGISQVINQGSKARPGSKRKLPNGFSERVAYTNRCKVALAPLFAAQTVKDA